MSQLNEIYVTLVGFQYHVSETERSKYGVGTSFKLQREEDNVYGTQAVGVYDGDRLVAYVKKDEAHLLWEHLIIPINCYVTEDGGSYMRARTWMLSNDGDESLKSLGSSLPDSEHEATYSPTLRTSIKKISTEFMNLQDIKDKVVDLIMDLEDLVGEFDMADLSDKYEKLEMLENAKDLADRVHETTKEYMADIALEKNKERLQELKDALRSSQNAIDYIDFDALIKEVEDDEDVDLPCSDLQDVISHLEDVTDWIDSHEEEDCDAAAEEFKSAEYHRLAMTSSFLHDDEKQGVDLAPQVDSYTEDIIRQLENTAREMVRYVDTFYHTKEVREVMERTFKQVEGDDTPMDIMVKFLLGADISIVYTSLGHTFGQGKLEDLGMMFISTFSTSINETIDKLGGWRMMLHRLGDATKAYMEGCDQVVLDEMPDGFNFWLEALLSGVDNEEWMTHYLVLMYRFASLVAKMDGVITQKEADWLAKIMVKDSEEAAVEVDDEPAVTEAGGNTAEGAMKELEDLIGLTEVKEEIARLRSFIQIQNRRKEEGLAVIPVSRHFVFTGNPGTGKTTVARILAQIYKDLGVVKGGQLIETDRSGLVAEYVGQTAVKTNKVVDSALDGVLFIDEAYSLVQGGKEDYGAEAIATLLKRMEDNRDRLVVILAGYSDEMQQFIDSNPGLQSRFNRYIHFPDYEADELLQIFKLLLSKHDFVMTADGEKKLVQKLTDAVLTKTKNFGNARFVRNLFEKTLENQAVRLSAQPRISHTDLITIHSEDI